MSNMNARSLTEDHFGGRLGRQPEDDERDEGQEQARNDEDVRVEEGDTLDPDLEREVGMWLPSSGDVS